MSGSLVVRLDGIRPCCSLRVSPKYRISISGCPNEDDTDEKLEDANVKARGAHGESIGAHRGLRADAQRRLLHQHANPTTNYGSKTLLDVDGVSQITYIQFNLADKNQYILVNVTSAVQAWLSGSETNNGLALVANSTFNATFESKENTTTIQEETGAANPICTGPKAPANEPIESRDSDVGMMKPEG
jgi:hypothetical protein